MSNLVISAPLAAATGEAAGKFPAHPTFMQNVEFLLLGLFIVMGTLTALWLLCEVIGFFFKQQAARAASKKPAEAQPAPAPAPQPAVAARAAAQDEEEDGIPVVVIAAAVAALIDQPHRVVEIRPSSPAWSLEGRRQLLSSHRLPR